MSAKRSARALGLAAGTLPVFVLVLAGVAKLNDPFLAGLFIHYTVAVPLSLGIILARVLGVVEIVVAFGVVALIGRSIVPALAAIGLFAVFIGLLLRLLLTTPRASTCGCFGDLFSDIGHISLWTQCALDVLLLALLIIHSLSQTGRPCRAG